MTTVSTFTLCISGSLSAQIIGVNNGGEIIAPPTMVLDSGVTNDHQQGFDEVQDVLLAAPLAVDSGFIPAELVVDSHMIFLILMAFPLIILV